MNDSYKHTELLTSWRADENGYDGGVVVRSSFLLLYIGKHSNYLALLQIYPTNPYATGL